MPWRETAPMKERMRFVTDWERDLYRGVGDRIALPSHAVEELVAPAVGVHSAGTNGRLLGE